MALTANTGIEKQTNTTTQNIILANKFDKKKPYIPSSSGYASSVNSKLDTYKGNYQEESDGIYIFGIINVQSLIITIIVIIVMLYLKKKYLDKEEEDDFRERF